MSRQDYRCSNWKSCVKAINYLLVGETAVTSNGKGFQCPNHN